MIESRRPRPGEAIETEEEARRRAVWTRERKPGGPATLVELTGWEYVARVKLPGSGGLDGVVGNMATL
ncbi:hypothetical protein CLIM01_13785 [Colletotrichum limetticola]|uniref:Uncharacterized protein n=1 Tax=Colletotrichum limetticola TaxID=1209924 RepID=A0ABQ9PAD7_9PEZI|nr:hypothetical protein CLIM01_13785 [Colletotrichum limetticola]